MYQNKRDKTRKQIINAFMELVSKYGIKEVTVKQIAELAGISRGTFYQHYYDKYAIFDDQKQMIFQEIISQQKLFLTKKESTLRMDLLEGKFVSKILDIVKDNQDVVAFLFNHDDGFRVQASDFLNE